MCPVRNGTYVSGRSNHSGNLNFTDRFLGLIRNKLTTDSPAIAKSALPAAVRPLRSGSYLRPPGPSLCADADLHTEPPVATSAAFWITSRKARSVRNSWCCSVVICQFQCCVVAAGASRLLAGSHSVGCCDEIRAAKLKRLACDAHVVQFLRCLGLRRCERSYIGDAEHIDLGLDFLLIESM